MLIERKVQIKAIKTEKYMAGRVGSTIMFTEGHFIVYMSERNCFIDISKLKEFPKDRMEEYSADKVEKLLKPIGLARKMQIHAGRTLRLFENRETGDRIWLDKKFVKKFDGCRPYSADMGNDNKVIVFTRSGKIVGLVLPVIVLEDLEGGK